MLFVHTEIVLPRGFRVQEAVKLLSAPPAPGPMGGWCQSVVDVDQVIVRSGLSAALVAAWRRGT